MQQLLTAPPQERPALFDGLRKHYPIRREFHRTTINLPKHMKGLRQITAGLGFLKISEDKVTFPSQ
jgi:hypothetical protein